VKKIALVSALGLLLISVIVRAAPVRDWHDLDGVHTHVQEAINEMERARANNHFDMGGHGEKAEELLRHAERELRAAVESARKDQ
jgi:hypothetical protein